MMLWVYVDSHHSGEQATLSRTTMWRWVMWHILVHLQGALMSTVPLGVVRCEALILSLTSARWTTRGGKRLGVTLKGQLRSRGDVIRESPSLDYIREKRPQILVLDGSRVHWGIAKKPRGNERGENMKDWEYTWKGLIPKDTLNGWIKFNFL